MKFLTKFSQAEADVNKNDQLAVSNAISTLAEAIFHLKVTLKVQFTRFHKICI